jgi:16S rRNA (cytidine1402-2'-O)-methyltransferase
MPYGILYLIPVPLGDAPSDETIPAYNTHLLDTISDFIVEDLRTARRHLRRMGMKQIMEDIHFHEIGKHADESGYISYLDAAIAGKPMGLLSDAGCPGVADPGAAIVRIAHEKKIRVVPLTGPSSLLLALMASGSNGQQFRFHGYLPKERADRIRKIKELERDARQKNETQLFIETPFRNDHMVEDLVLNCQPDTLLCVACDIAQPSEFIQTRNMAAWAKQRPLFHKRPAVFIICAP